MMFHSRYFTNRLCFCLGLLDLYQKTTLETKLEKSFLQKNVNFLPRQKYRGMFFSTATVFLIETLKNPA